MLVIPTVQIPRFFTAERSDISSKKHNYGFGVCLSAHEHGSYCGQVKKFASLTDTYDGTGWRTRPRVSPNSPKLLQPETKSDLDLSF